MNHSFFLFTWRFIWGLLALGKLHGLWFPPVSTQNKGCVSAQSPSSSMSFLSLFCSFYASCISAALGNSNTFANLCLCSSLCPFLSAGLWARRLCSVTTAQPSTEHSPGHSKHPVNEWETVRVPYCFLVHVIRPSPLEYTEADFSTKELTDCVSRPHFYRWVCLKKKKKCDS